MFVCVVGVRCEVFGDLGFRIGDKGQGFGVQNRADQD